MIGGVKIMAEIIVLMKDGEKKIFPEESRPGGSYVNLVKYEGCFAIIQDVWGNKTVIPAADIKEIQISSDRRW